MKNKNNVSVKNGIFYINDKPLYLITGDYPYYRDSADLWNNKLKSIKKLGIDVITFYVPWRHHYVLDNNKKIFDFTGITAKNRNVVKFIKLCKKNNLFVIIKPGPFIHAETNYGGLIDEVNPDINNKIEPMKNIYNESVNWQGKPLPAPLDKTFSKYVRQWLKEFKSNLLDKFKYPAGPIIGVQIANEGIYSNSGSSINDYDYSGSSISKFKKELNVNYNIHKWDYPSKRKDVLKYYRWAEFQATYVYNFYKLIINSIKTELPKLINLNPFSREYPHIDGWFVRNNIEKWKNIVYGFTNWIGLVSYKKEIYYKYLILIKRSKGFNLEENWGFHKLYDKKFYYPILPYFQSLLIMANGVKGFNVYTVVGTDKWDDNIDSFHSRPYPASAPITADNKKNNKYLTLHSIIKFVKKHYSVFVSSENLIDLEYGFYLPEFYFSVWDYKRNASYWKSLGFDYPFGADKKIFKTISLLRENNIDFNFINIQQKLKNRKKPILFFSSGLLDSDTEDNILDFVRDGGIFIIFGKIPEFNAIGNKLKKLKKVIYQGNDNNNIKFIEYGKGTIIYSSINPFKFNKSKKFREVINVIFNEINHKRIVVSDENSEVFIHFDESTNIYIVYVFNLKSKNREIFVDISAAGLQGRLEVTLVSRGAGIILIRDNKVLDYLIKRENELERKKVNKVSCFFTPASSREA